MVPGHLEELEYTLLLHVSKSMTPTQHWGQDITGSQLMGRSLLRHTVNFETIILLNILVITLS